MNKDKFKQKWRDKVQKGIDTSVLQFEALYLFLDDLGYTLKRERNQGNFHIVNTVKDNNPKFMSLEQAVALYNGSSLITINGDTASIMGTGFIFSYNLLRRAREDKILKVVHLQRKGGKIVPSTNWVNFSRQADPLENY